MTKAVNEELNMVAVLHRPTGDWYFGVLTDDGRCRVDTPAGTELDEYLPFRTDWISGTRFNPAAPLRNVRVDYS